MITRSSPRTRRLRPPGDPQARGASRGRGTAQGQRRRAGPFPEIAGFPARRSGRVRESAGFRRCARGGPRIAGFLARPSRNRRPSGALGREGPGFPDARAESRRFLDGSRRKRRKGPDSRTGARRRAGRTRIPGRHSTPVTKQGAMEISQGTLTSSRAPSQSCEGNSDEKGSNRVRSEPTTEH